MYPNNSTASDSRSVVNAAALNILRDSIVNGGDTMVEMSLLSLFFGEDVDLVLESPFSPDNRCFDSSILHLHVLSAVRKGPFSLVGPELTPRDSRHRSLTHTNVRILVFSTVLLYLSNGAYVAALIWNRTQANRLVLGAMDGLFSPAYDGAHEMGAFEDGMRKQCSMAVFALQINVRSIPRNRTNSLSHLVSTAVDDWRLCRLVAGMRDLAQQGRLLRRTASVTLSFGVS